MAKLLSNKRRASEGFTLIETIVAMFIFAVGILSLAALMAAVALSTDRGRYASTATLLATEKLEDLNRYAAASQAASVEAGGRLDSDVAGYFDSVQVQSDLGTITEVTYVPEAGCYEVFKHTIGTVSSPGNATDTGITPQPSGNCPTTPPPSITDAVTFHRRWMVENPVVISGKSVQARRITVWISLWSSSNNAPLNYQGQPVTYQLSTVRPCGGDGTTC
jgi:type II secretory pathway pseudopilin PulG